MCIRSVSPGPLKGTAEGPGRWLRGESNGCAGVRTQEFRTQVSGCGSLPVKPASGDGEEILQGELPSETSHISELCI